MTASATSPVNSRLTCSMAEWFDDTSTKRWSLQFGQSSHPRPEPVRRTAAPDTTMVISRPRATAVMVR